MGPRAIGRGGTVAVVGGYGTALIFSVQRAPGAGETVLAGSLATDHGGKGSNQAVAARRLGAEVALLTAVGPDAFGARGRDLWREEGVDATCVRLGRLPTMMGAILVEAGGENRIVVGMGALGELTSDDVDAFSGAIAGAQVCAVSLELPPEVAVCALRMARDHGTLAILNPAPPAALPPDVIAGVDVIVPNRSEAEALTGSPPGAPAAQLVDQLRLRTRARIVLTLGPDGALADDGARRVHVAAQPAKVVDTTGAGDAFTGALSAALARGFDLFGAVRIATTCASLSVEKPSVIPSLPRLGDLPEVMRGRLGAPAQA